MLKIKNLSKTYPNGVQALRFVDLEIPRGMFGLLGPNGAGKSTLMRTLATLQEADSGTAFLGDLDVLKDTLYCEAADSPSRRASQAVLYEALGRLVVVMAPILSFTADEVWGFMKHVDGDLHSPHALHYKQVKIVSDRLVRSGGHLPLFVLEQSG